MKKVLLIALAWFFPGSPAMADPTTDDIHCYIVSLQMITAADPTQKIAGTMAHSYWLGKIDGRAPQLDLEASVLAALPAMANQDLFWAEAVRCGQEMIKRGQAETEIGKDIQRRAADQLHDQQVH
jgi:hypothetical protein